eukprot:3629-Rhodomonas_salina.2
MLALGFQRCYVSESSTAVWRAEVWETAIWRAEDWRTELDLEGTLARDELVVDADEPCRYRQCPRSASGIAQQTPARAMSPCACSSGWARRVQVPTEACARVRHVRVRAGIRRCKTGKDGGKVGEGKGQTRLHEHLDEGVEEGRGALFVEHAVLGVGGAELRVERLLLEVRRVPVRVGLHNHLPLPLEHRAACRRRARCHAPHVLGQRRELGPVDRERGAGADKRSRPTRHVREVVFAVDLRDVHHLPDTRRAQPHAVSARTYHRPQTS